MGKKPVQSTMPDRLPSPTGDSDDDLPSSVHVGPLTEYTGLSTKVAFANGTSANVVAASSTIHGLQSDSASAEASNRHETEIIEIDGRPLILMQNNTDCTLRFPSAISYIPSYSLSESERD